jgi:hypothetical protein
MASLTALPGVADAILPQRARRPVEQDAHTAFLPAPLLSMVPTQASVSPLRRWLRPAVIGTAIAGTLILAAVSAAAGTRGDAPLARMQVEAAPAAQSAGCQAMYRVSQDDGKRFAGELTVVNTGTAALRDWTISFRYAAGQQATAPGWNQTGDAVLVGPVADELRPGDQVRYPFRGTYDVVNPMPIAFTLGNVACEALLVGPVSAAPPKPQAQPHVQPAAKPRPDGDHKRKGKDGRD